MNPILHQNACFALGQTVDSKPIFNPYKYQHTGAEPSIRTMEIQYAHLQDDHARFLKGRRGGKGQPRPTEMQHILSHDPVNPPTPHYDAAMVSPQSVPRRHPPHNSFRQSPFATCDVAEKDAHVSPKVGGRSKKRKPSGKDVSAKLGSLSTSEDFSVEDTSVQHID